MLRKPLGIIGLGVLIVAGCGGPSTEEVIVRFSDPVQALAAGDAELVALLESIEADSLMASQLDQPSLPLDSNAAAALSKAYNTSIHTRLDEFVAPLARADGDLRKRRDFLRRNIGLVEETAAAADLPHFQFEVGHRYGYFARMQYLDDATLASRILLTRALDYAVVEDNVHSLENYTRALRMVEGLSRVKRMEARVLAAQLRGEALEIADALFSAALYDRFEAEQLYGVLRDQLAAWPTDRAMLIGERAAVIHAYEAIRAGMLSRLLTIEEIAWLENQQVLDTLYNLPAEEINSDQRRYLLAMNQLMETTEAPLEERAEITSKIANELTKPAPRFAALLFWPDVERALRAVARDRANVESWTIALAAVADLKTPPFTTSPLNGQPYRVERNEEGVTVYYGAAFEESVALPLLSN